MSSETIGATDHDYGSLLRPAADTAFRFPGPSSPDQYGCLSAAYAMAIRVLGNECDPRDLDRISARLPNTLTTNEQEVRLAVWLSRNGYKLEVALPENVPHDKVTNNYRQCPNISVVSPEGFMPYSFDRAGNKLGSEPLTNYMKTACQAGRVGIFSTQGPGSYHAETFFSLESNIVYDKTSSAYRFNPNERGGMTYVDTFSNMAKAAIFICGVTLVSKE
jgi:hypothetical protein